MNTLFRNIYTQFNYGSANKVQEERREKTAKTGKLKKVDPLNAS